MGQSSGNVAAPWTDFDPREYLLRNYTTVRQDDREVLEVVRDFFHSSGVRQGRGIDVGTGSNLYPALAMLPFCRSITLYEHARTNVEWLIEQSARAWPSWGAAWKDFWSLLRERAAYACMNGSPRRVLADRVAVTEGSVFDLDGGSAPWDMGTMFFVAESITDKHEEFAEAVRIFLSALRPGAPFAIAFMENSLGYEVAGVRFPAVAIDADDVRKSLTNLTVGTHVSRIPAQGSKLREGYTGMIVACGHIARPTIPQSGVNIRPTRPRTWSP